MTIGWDGYIVGVKTKEGRGSAHHELIWEIPANLVSPTNAVAWVLEALEMAAARGLRLSLVSANGGHEGGFQLMGSKGTKGKGKKGTKR